MRASTQQNDYTHAMKHVPLILVAWMLTISFLAMFVNKMCVLDTRVHKVFFQQVTFR